MNKEAVIGLQALKMLVDAFPVRDISVSTWDHELVELKDDTWHTEMDAAKNRMILHSSCPNYAEQAVDFVIDGVESIELRKVCANEDSSLGGWNIIIEAVVKTADRYYPLYIQGFKSSGIPEWEELRYYINLKLHVLFCSIRKKFIKRKKSKKRG